jgi:hypothetical protein
MLETNLASEYRRVIVKNICFANDDFEDEFHPQF